MTRPARHGALAGVRVVELGGIGPVPFAGMLLADLGADVVRIDRPGSALPTPSVVNRGKRSAALDLRDPQDNAVARRLAAEADVLIEGFRPGVAERLGLGPEQCWADNPRLVFGRMTGWGQDGPLALEVGHDISYIATTGALHAIGTAAGPPIPPLALVGDLGGGAMFLVTGVLAALREASLSGLGQVVDAAIVDGVAALMTPIYGMLADGEWIDERGSNLLDTGRPWYDVYATSDGAWIAVGAIEEPFWLALLDVVGIAPDAYDRGDPACWSALREELAAIFAGRTQAEWEKSFAGSDACAAPVLSMTEAPRSPHLRARGTFAEVDGVALPEPAPRLSRTPSARGAAPTPGGDTAAVRDGWPDA